jgi:hypothetical protein
MQNNWTKVSPNTLASFATSCPIKETWGQNLGPDGTFTDRGKPGTDGTFPNFSTDRNW